MKDVAVRRKILEATINSIELFGIEGCTIRAISKEAGVTLSSIHYYYESKEELVEAALNQAISGSFEDIQNMWQEGGEDTKSSLCAILSFLFEGAIRYPGITRAGLYPLLMQGKTDGPFIVSLNAFLSIVTDTLSRQQKRERKEISRKLMTAFSSVLFLGISMEAYESFSAISFAEDKSRLKLIESLLADIF